MSALRDRGVYQNLRFLYQTAEVLIADKAFSVDFVDIFGARRASRKPAVFSHHLQPANGLVVARRMAKNLGDGFTGQAGGLDLLGRQFTQQGFLLRGGLGIDTGGERQAEVLGHLLVQLRRIATGTGGHLCGQQRRDQAVLVSGPDTAVHTQE